VLQGHIRQNNSKFGLAQARLEGNQQTPSIADIRAEFSDADAGADLGASGFASSKPTLVTNAAFLAPESDMSQMHLSSHSALGGVNTLGGRQAHIYSHSVNTLDGCQAHLSSHSVSTLGGGRPSRKLAVAIRRLEGQVGGLFVSAELLFFLACSRSLVWNMCVYGLSRKKFAVW
jgi:hypothetical protein